MFKKTFPSFLVFAIFLSFSGTAIAQLNFFNGTSCSFKVQVTTEIQATPCIGPSCSVITWKISPNGMTTIPAGPCLTNGVQGYREVRVLTTGGTIVANKCFGPNPIYFQDCIGAPRQLNIIAPNFAAIF